MKAALRLISRDNNNGLLKFDSQISETETVREVLMKKHPPQQPAKISSIVTGDTQTTEPHPVFFDKIDRQLIRRTVLRMDGATCRCIQCPKLTSFPQKRPQALFLTCENPQKHLQRGYPTLHRWRNSTLSRRNDTRRPSGNGNVRHCHHPTHSPSREQLKHGTPTMPQQVETSMISKPGGMTLRRPALIMITTRTPQRHGS